MNSDEFKSNFIENMKKNNGDNLKKATEEIGKVLGGNSAGVEAILNNEDILNGIVKNVSPDDLQKIGQLINNPELLKLILNSDKGKKAIKDIFEK